MSHDAGVDTLWNKALAKHPHQGWSVAGPDLVAIHSSPSSTRPTGPCPLVVRMGDFTDTTLAEKSSAPWQQQTKHQRADTTDQRGIWAFDFEVVDKPYITQGASFCWGGWWRLRMPRERRRHIPYEVRPCGLHHTCHSTWLPAVRKGSSVWVHLVEVALHQPSFIIMNPCCLGKEMTRHFVWRSRQQSTPIHLLWGPSTHVTYYLHSQIVVVRIASLVHFWTKIDVQTTKNLKTEGV
jgi:hypothetical protein